MTFSQALAESIRSYRAVHKALKNSEKVTPKEYGMYLEKKKHRRKERK